MTLTRSVSSIPIKSLPCVLLLGGIKLPLQTNSTGLQPSVFSKLLAQALQSKYDIK